ncbi:NADPH-dependent F420 reductase [Microbacterium sp. NIBRBAC000506063]|uniref:NADPH-dependent F420 reductase n=1 Tax=Microbacterium sp. NIBRBAC000506063 TaxID=2734618 RepID=UPI001BB6FB77|nr:NAD(P)-binding domain-containing protein [Microbacterium sp. NIBRBAC000506063]QTV79978.1 NAD(P)-binding domain-containing protein [Microbacterium sp. NIBRBAC000506063]
MAVSAGRETVAVLGVGRVGTAIARALVDAGYRVLIAASGDPEKLAAITRIVVPGAEPRWAREAIAEAEIVVLSLPLHRVVGLDPAPLAGKVVIDGMNYWPPVDGVIPMFEDAPDGTSAIVQSLLTGAKVVKTFNHTGYHDLEPDRRPAGHPDRRALAVAGDDPAAVKVASGLVDRVGYDAVPSIVSATASPSSRAAACSVPGCRHPNSARTSRRRR